MTTIRLNLFQFSFTLNKKSVFFTLFWISRAVVVVVSCILGQRGGYWRDVWVFCEPSEPKFFVGAPRNAKNAKKTAKFNVFEIKQNSQKQPKMTKNHEFSKFPQCLRYCSGYQNTSKMVCLKGLGHNLTFRTRISHPSTSLGTSQFGPKHPLYDYELSTQIITKK